MKANRVKTSVKNIYFSIFLQFTSIFLNYFLRFVFIKTLSEVYLGASGLFSNILTILSLAELGIGSAIVYAMYDPIAKNDEKKIKAYLNFYKKSYRLIALIVLIIGLSLTPFLSFLIDKDTILPNITLIYMLYLFDTVVSYLCVYKTSLLNAMQKNYIYNKYQIISKFVTSGLLILSLIIFKNFIIYLTIQVLCKLITNILISCRVDKLFPFIKDNKDNKLSKKEEKNIFKNVYALFCNQIGSVLINGTDNIIISKFINLASVGFYSNYYLITGSLSNLIGQMFNSIIAIVGNIGTEKNYKKNFDLFNKIYFANAVIAIIFITILSSCITDFIHISFGEKYVLNSITVFIILFNFYMLIMKNVVGTFKYALGIFWEDKYCNFIKAIINVTLSVLLVFKYKLFGVFLATAISDILTIFWVQPVILYKKGFDENPLHYFIQYFKYSLVTIIDIVLSLYLINILNIKLSFFKVIIEVTVSGLISFITIIILYFRKEEFQYFLNIIKNKLKKKVI